MPPFARPNHQRYPSPESRSRTYQKRVLKAARRDPGTWGADVILAKGASTAVVGTVCLATCLGTKMRTGRVVLVAGGWLGECDPRGLVTNTLERSNAISAAVVSDADCPQSTRHPPESSQV